MIRYLEGDATAPVGAGPKIIAHVCNDIGRWGRGFVLAISQRWREPKEAYRAWYKGGEAAGFGLGGLQLVQVEEDVWVANMIAQHGIRYTEEGPPIRYGAVESCLDKLAVEARRLGASVHMPRIGAGLAGGDWSEIEDIISATLLEARVEVTVYDFV